MKLIATTRSFAGEDGESLVSIHRCNIGRPDFYVCLETSQVDEIQFKHMEDLRIFLEELERAWDSSPC